MKNFTRIATEASDEIKKLLSQPLSPEETTKLEIIVEKAVIKGLLEGQHRAVDAAIHCPEAEQDIAHKVASAIRRKNDLLIANLASMR
ncbi:MAG: hypothetical protein ACC634_01530 [Hyphomicrobiales bacterium]